MGRSDENTVVSILEEGNATRHSKVIIFGRFVIFSDVYDVKYSLRASNNGRMAARGEEGVFGMRGKVVEEDGFLCGRGHERQACRRL